VKEKESGSILHKGIGHKDDVCDICFSPDDKYIASASYDKTIRIWEASTLECKHVLKGHSNVVMSVSFSPDGKCIVSTSLDDTIRVWDVLTGLCVFVIDNKFQSASYFTTDGSHIVSNISDNRADIWEFLPIQNLIDQTRERFNNRPLTPEERKKYYLD
jgi:WD40 repeat protein